MRIDRRPIACLLTATSIGIWGGCGGSPPSVDSSHSEATVKGVVKIGGVPATEGEIVFDPSNYQRKDVASRPASIGKDGTYTIKTLTGINMVRLGGSLVKKHPIAGRQSHELDVKAGENSYDFEAKDEK